MARGKYVSDVFLGYRQVPHCIIAVRSESESDFWILRATINSDQFDALVRTGIIGEGGDAFIVNKSGFFQTVPKAGSVLAPSGLNELEVFRGVKESRIEVEGSLKIQETAWINDNNWLLVVRQDASEISAPVNRAMATGAIVVLVAMGITLVTTFIATRHLTNKIDKANKEREEMVRAFMRSSKLASIGELATGLAHEINNPLAIISADQTNIADIISGLNSDIPELNEVGESVERCKRQIQRCKIITTKMLQFGRKRETELQPSDLKKSLQEINSLLARQASVRNVNLTFSAEENLPSVMIDPLELEQVLVNLIHNSFDALPNGGTVEVTAQRFEKEVLVEVRDNGIGIPLDNLERIFEPFFTTKEVGKGTGLGLSVCYGIIQSWGGRMEAVSGEGKGTTMRLRIPLSQSR